MFQKKTLIVGFIVVALGLAFGTFFIRSNHKQDTKQVGASSANTIITSQVEWDSGTKNNIDSASLPGSLKIQNLSSSQITLNDKTITASPVPETAVNAVDGNIDSAWGPVHLVITQDYVPNNFWKVDLSQEYSINKFRVSYGYGNDIDVLYSTDDISYSMLTTGFTTPPPYPSIGYYEVNLGTPVVARYWKIVMHMRWWGSDATADMTLNEVELYQANPSAVHTTAPTQIDGEANFWSWGSFSPTQNVPANTSVTYRFRSSADGTTWNPWHATIGAVESRSGNDSNNPTLYRFLQVEATLSNTDGASTPTIDSYSIGYHTNQKPNKPTAMTAVVN